MYVVPLLIGLLALVVIYDLRRRSAERHLTEVRHIEASQEFLASHQAFLTEFLASSAPSGVKALLIRLSDLTGDRAAMASLASSLLTRPTTAPDDESSRLLSQVADMRKDHPDLMQVFASAVTNGVMAGILRWPETASRYEQLVTRLLTDPARDVNVAASLSRWHSSTHDAGGHAVPAHAMA